VHCLLWSLRCNGYNTVGAGGCACGAVMPIYLLTLCSITLVLLLLLLLLLL
jgi:hypothetical protein